MDLRWPGSTTVRLLKTTFQRAGRFDRRHPFGGLRRRDVPLHCAVRFQLTDVCSRASGPAGEFLSIPTMWWSPITPPQSVMMSRLRRLVLVGGPAPESVLSPSPHQRPFNQITRRQDIEAERRRPERRCSLKTDGQDCAYAERTRHVRRAYKSHNRPSARPAYPKIMLISTLAG